MRAPYFIEILARNGDMLSRHEVAALPIRLGRGYDNDVILDDDHTAAAHAVIEQDEAGQLILRDLGSRNGTVQLGKRRSVVTMTGDTVVRLGHTNVRVRSADFAVPPERVDTTMHGWEGAIPGLVGLLMIGGAAAFMTWLTDTASFQTVRYLQAVAGVLGAAMLWCGVWAFANRLLGRHTRFGRHLFILGCALAAMAVFTVASSVAAYAWSFEWITRYASLVGILIVCTLLFFHLSTIKPHHPRRFASACVLLFILSSGLRLMSNQQSTGRLADELYMPLLLAPSLRHSPDHSVDEFIGAASKMKLKLDAERTKKVKGDGSDSDDEEE